MKKLNPLFDKEADNDSTDIFANPEDTFRRSLALVKNVKLEMINEHTRFNLETLEQKKITKLNNKFMFGIVMLIIMMLA